MLDPIQHRGFGIVLVVLLGLIAFLLIVPSVEAGKPQPLTLVDEFGGQVNLPTTCMNEDDIHVRTWTGYLAAGQGLITTERLCDSELDGSPPGGIGLLLAVSSRAPLTIYIRQPAPQWEVGWPLPVYPFPDVTPLPGEGRVCVVPPFDISTGAGWGGLQGGEYQIVVRNDGSRTARDIRITLTSRMAWPFQQQNRCAVEHQNLVS